MTGGSEHERIERELRDSRDRLRLALAAAGMGVWDWDVESGALRWSGGLEAVHGMRPGTFDGTLEGFLRVIHPDDRERVGAEIERALAERSEAFETEFRVVGHDGRIRWVAGYGRAVCDVSGRAVGMLGVGRDVTARRVAEERRHLLADVGLALDGPLSLEERLDDLGRALVPRVADGVAIDLVGRGGGIERVAAVHVDPGREALLRSLDPPADGPIARVVAGSGPVLLEDDAATALGGAGDPDAERRRALGLRSAVVAPIEARGSRIGALTLATGVRDSDRRFGDEELDLAREIAARSALSIDNARLYEAEREAAERIRFLAEAGELLGGSLDLDETLASLAQIAVPRLGEWCVIDLVEEGRIRNVVIAHSDPESARWARELRRRYPPDLGAPGPATEAMRTGRPQLGGEVTDEDLAAAARDEEHLELLRRAEIGSFICVPLAARERTLGVLSLIAGRSGRRLDERDVELATELAARAATAIDNARLYRAQRHIAHTLQEALLPPDLPAAPGLRAASAYLPAGEGVEAGGDFYDLFQAGDGRWLLVIGDVCGKGPSAASLTALARYSLRAFARDESDPPRLLEALNDLVLRQRPGNTQFLTACVIAADPLDTGGARLRASSAGHPRPLVARRSGDLEWLEDGSGLVGVFPDLAVRSSDIELAPGDRLVLYTDGVTESRADGAFFGEDGLARALGAASAGGAETIAEEIARAVRAFTGDRLRDDVAVLAVEATGAGPGTAARPAGGTAARARAAS